MDFLSILWVGYHYAYLRYRKMEMKELPPGCTQLITWVLKQGGRQFSK